jgi:hypothetical protein
LGFSLLGGNSNFKSSSGGFLDGKFGLFIKLFLVDLSHLLHVDSVSVGQKHGDSDKRVKFHLFNFYIIIRTRRIIHSEQFTPQS